MTSPNGNVFNNQESNGPFTPNHPTLVHTPMPPRRTGRTRGILPVLPYFVEPGTPLNFDANLHQRYPYIITAFDNGHRQLAEIESDDPETPVRQHTMQATLYAPNRPVESDDPMTPVRQPTTHTTMYAPNRPVESDEPMTPVRQPTVVTNVNAPQKKKQKTTL